MTEPEGPWTRPPKPAGQAGSEDSRRRWLIWLGLVAAAGAAFVGLLWFFPSQAVAANRTSLIYDFGLLTLVTSSLVFARQFKLRQTIQYLVIWTGLLAVIVVGYTFRDDMRGAFLKIRGEIAPAYAVSLKPHSLSVNQEADGSFYIMGKVNGLQMKFLLDTGASDIVLSPADAQRLGMDAAALKFDRSIETANGVGHAAFTTVDHLVVGDLALSSVEVSVNQTPMATSVLGMAFFRRLETFTVRGAQMTLKWR